MRNQFKTLSLILAIATPFAAQAADPSFYFSAVGSTGSTLSSLTIGGVGTSFTFSVWLQTSVTFTGGNAFVGFDTTNSTGMGATPTANLFSADSSTAITN
jgi:hypothetical protein